MSKLIKILHVDPDYQIIYFIFGPRWSIRTSVPLQQAIELLKKEDFDLIMSEPHNKAILKNEPNPLESKAIRLDQHLILETDHDDPGEVRSNQYP